MIDLNEATQAPKPRVRTPRSVNRDIRQTARMLLLAATITAIITVALVVLAGIQVFTITEGPWKLPLSIVSVTLIVSTATLMRPLALGFRNLKQANNAHRSGDKVNVRVHAARAETQGWISLGFAIPFLVIVFMIAIMIANNHAVQTVFFNVEFMWTTLSDIAVAFVRNIGIALAAEVIVLVFGLMLAIARMMPGKAGRPIRVLATVYVDGFRAIPGIIVIYLIGFGLPLSQIPVISELGTFWSAVLALGITHAAYVAEVFRAGIQSVHHSQTSAARSLGLSYPKTLQYVIVPQAVRRVMPPLLNSFVGLQKDTALVTVIGLVEAFTQATTYASRYFNLSSVTLVAVLFIIITIPQTRFVDYLIDRDHRRFTAKG